MRNVTVDIEEIEQQEREDEKAAEELFKSKRGSKRLAAIVDGGTTPARFEAPAEEGGADEADEPDLSADGGIADEADESDSADKGDGEETTGESEGQEKETEDETAGEEEEEASALPEAVTNTLKEAFPDKDFSDAEELQGTIEQLVGDSQALKAEREANAKVYDLFENSEELVQVARHMDSGKSFLEALALTVDFNDTMGELKEEDPEEYKKVLKAQALREAELERRQAEQKAMEKEFRDNEEASQQNISSFQQEKGMDDKTKDEFLGKINDHFSNIVRGNITPEFLEMMYKALNYEVDMEKAQEEGKIRGRNEKINAKKRERVGDGLPQIRGGKERKPKPQASSGKRALAAMVLNSKSTFE